MLNFIGIGSAFNTMLGNNSAYFIRDKVLYMIDCGSSTFSKLRELGILSEIEKITVFVTHTHPDHVGSLGDLIFYSYYSMGKIMEPEILIVADGTLHIPELLDIMGVDPDTYKIMETTTYLEDRVYSMRNIETDFKIRFQMVPVTHVPEIDCFGYIFEIDEQKIWYSGDCNELPEEIVEKINAGYFDFVYQDTCKADYEGNVHLSLKKLTDLINVENRNKVWCMHLDEKFDVKEAQNLGFNVVSPDMNMF